MSVRRFRILLGNQGGGGKVNFKLDGNPCGQVGCGRARGAGWLLGRFPFSLKFASSYPPPPPPPPPADPPPPLPNRILDIFTVQFLLLFTSVLCETQLNTYIELRRIPPPQMHSGYGHSASYLFLATSILCLKSVEYIHSVREKFWL